MTILTVADVQEIRRVYTGGKRGRRSNALELSCRFGVGITTIYEVAGRRAWANVPEETVAP